MAQSLVSMGASAQIITHPRFLNAPVVQTKKRGRHPKAVASIWAYKIKRYIAEDERNHARTVEPALVLKIAELRGNIAGAESFLRNAQAQLLALAPSCRSARSGAAHV